MAKVSPAVRPGQVVMYNGWDPAMFPDWRGPMDLEPGMVKPLHLAGGYGHITYRPGCWQPVPVDRATRVDVEVDASHDPRGGSSKGKAAAASRRDRRQPNSPK